MRKGRKAAHDSSFLEMALVGFEAAKAKIEAEIHSIQVQLGRRGKQLKKSFEEIAPTRKKRTLSAKARRAISLAQKKRWSDARKAGKSR